MGMAMFFAFSGIASSQFHGYLFEVRGQGALAIGLLMMTGYAAGIGAPLAQVQLIRKWHGPFWPLALVTLAGAVSMAYLPHAPGFWGLWCDFAVLSFCIASIFPLLNAAALESARDRGHAFFVGLRAYGTAGFMIACLLCMAVPRKEKLPLIYAGFGVGFLAALIFIAPAARHHGRQRLASALASVKGPKLKQAWRRLFRGEAIGLVALLAAMNFANVMVTALQGNYLIHEFGVSQKFISMAWVFATACELFWMALCARAVKAMDIRRVIVLGLWGTLIKLLLLATAANYAAYVFGLVFHGLFFSFTLTGFGVYLDRRFRPKERPALQTLTSGLVLGFPAALAGLSGGWLWHAFQLRAVYIAAAVLAAVICVVAEVWARRRMRRPLQVGQVGQLGKAKLSARRSSKLPRL